MRSIGITDITKFSDHKPFTKKIILSQGERNIYSRQESLVLNVFFIAQVINAWFASKY